MMTVPLNPRSSWRRPTLAIRRRIRAVFAGSLALGILSCAGSYNAKYFPGPSSEKSDGKILIYTTPEEDKDTFTDRPTGFVGAVTVVQVPIGEISRGAALRAFDNAFSGGAVSANSLDDAGGYRFVVHPHVSKFSYSYSLVFDSKPGLKPTVPNVSATVLVEVIGSKGAAIWHETFDINDFSGEQIVGGIHMAEKVSATTHRAIYQLMNNAADRIRYDLVNAPGQKDSH